MDTLKLTTLTLLMPFGWIMSEAAAAYPEPLQQTDIFGERDPKTGCAARREEPKKFSVPMATEHGHPDIIAIQRAPGETTSHLQDRDSHAGTCRLDLDRIEID